MTADHPSAPDGLTHLTLVPIVRRQLGQPTADVVAWRSAPVGYHAFLPGRAVWRVSGQARVADTRLDWTLILKQFAPPATTAADGRSRPPREVLAYRSGLLSRLPGRLAAPRLLQADQDATGVVRLWLEAIGDRYDGRWPFAHYSLAARHLGQFNGAYLAGRPLPAAPWLQQHWAEEHSMLPRRAAWLPDIERMVTAAAAMTWSLPAGLADRAARLPRDQERFIDVLNRLPQTLCHHDAAQANLFARTGRDGEDETVAIDWEEVGPGAIGAEVATLVFGTIRRGTVPAARAEALDRLVWTGYLAGLRDAGWRGDEASARLGFAAAVALRWSLLRSALRLLIDAEARTEVAAQHGLAADAFIVDRLHLLGYLLDRADEARRLAAD